MIHPIFGALYDELNCKPSFGQILLDLPPYTRIELSMHGPDGYYTVLFASLHSQLEAGVGIVQVDIDGQEQFSIVGTRSLENAYISWPPVPRRTTKLIMYNNTPETQPVDIVFYGILVREDKIEEYRKYIGSNYRILKTLEKINEKLDLICNRLGKILK